MKNLNELLQEIGLPSVEELLGKKCCLTNIKKNSIAEIYSTISSVTNYDDGEHVPEDVNELELLCGPAIYLQNGCIISSIFNDGECMVWKNDTESAGFSFKII